MDEPIYSLNHLGRLLVENPNRDWREYGNVFVNHDGDFSQFCYEQKMILTKQWNWFEQVSRGLILNNKTGKVVARPFDKFWNWGQGNRLPDDTMTCVGQTRKIDGSLGIQFFDGEKWRIVTKGSFKHRHGQWATEWLNSYCHPENTQAGLTLIYEIVYRDNAQIVPYKEEGLTLIGARFFDGAYYHPGSEQFKFVAMRVGVPTVDFRLIDPVQEQIEKEVEHEGWVSWWRNGMKSEYTLFKHKTRWYKALHKMIVTEGEEGDTDGNARVNVYMNRVKELKAALEQLPPFQSLDMTDPLCKKEMAVAIQNQFPLLAKMLLPIVFHGITVEESVVKSLT